MTNTTTAERRPVYLSELQRTQAELEAAQRANEELRRQLVAKSTEQITDGADPRLEQFWSLAGDAADDADFCDEYDKIAEAMGGPVRERDWDVEHRVTLTVFITRTVRARDEDDACERAMEAITHSDVIDEIREDEPSLEFDVYSASRA